MLHLLYGKDRGLAAHQLERLAHGLPLQLRTDDLDQALAAARTASWTGERHVVVAWDVTVDEVAAVRLMEAQRRLAHELVVYAPSLDRRAAAVRALLQEVDALAVEPSPKELLTLVAEAAARRGIPLAPAALHALDARGASFLDLWSEVEKAWLYQPPGQPVTAEALRRVQYRPAPDELFAFLDAVLGREPARAVRALRSLCAAGEEPLRVSSLLVRQWRLLAYVKSGQPLPPDLKVHPYVRDKLAGFAPRWDLGEVQRGFRVLLELDARLKSGRDAAAAFTLCLASLLGAP